MQKSAQLDAHEILWRLSHLEYGPVRNFEDLCQAFHLVFKEYHALKYTHPFEEKSKMRFGIYQLFSHSHTFIVKTGNTYCGTACVLEDSDLGLPADSLFREELDALRNQGRKITEGTMLSCISSHGKRAGDFSIIVQKLGHWWNHYHDKDDFLVVVNPRHVPFWKDKMGYQICSDEKSYSNVQGAPGYLLRLDVKALRDDPEKASPWLKQYFLNEPYPKSLYDHSFHIRSNHVVELLLSNPHLITEASDKQRVILKNSFPDLFRLTHFDFENHSHQLKENKNKEPLGYLAPTPQWLKEHSAETQVLTI